MSSPLSASLNSQQTSIRDVQELSLKEFNDERGMLRIYQTEVTDLYFKRVFSISVPVPGIQRGSHAHRACAQLFFFYLGECLVSITDAVEQRSFLCDAAAATALWVPPGLWVSLDFKKAPTLINVLCTNVYDEGDYIRDYNEFLKFKAGMRS